MNYLKTYIFLLLHIGLIVQAQDWRGFYQQAMSAYTAKDYKTALPHFQKAEAAGMAEFGELNPNYRMTVAKLADTYLQLGDFKQSATIYLSLIRALKTARNTQSNEYSEALVGLGRAYATGKAFPRAAQAYDEAIEVYRSRQGTKSVDYFDALYEAGKIYVAGQKYVKAEEYYGELYKNAGLVIGTKSERYLTIIKEYADILYAYRKFADAIAKYDEFLKITATTGSLKDLYGEVYQRQAVSYFSLSKPNEGAAAYNKYLQYQGAALAQNPAKYAEELYRSVEIFEQLPKYDEAVKILRQLIDIKSKQPDATTEIVGLYYRLGDNLSKIKNYAEAQTAYQKGLEIMKKTGGETKPEYARGIDCVAQLCMIQGKATEAEANFKKANEIRQKNLGVDNSEYTGGLDKIASFYIQQGRLAEAKVTVEEAMKIREKKPGINHPEYGHSLGLMAQIHIKQNNYKDADPLLLRKSDIYKVYYGAGSKEYGICMKDIADSYKVQKKYKPALGIYQMALSLVPSAEDNASILSSIKQIEEELKSGVLSNAP